MNDLTRQLVAETAKKHKSLARAGGFQFDSKVMSAHWNYLLIEFGIDLKARALRLWEQFHPEQFEDGFLKTHNNQVYDIEIRLSEKVKRVMLRKIEREPELNLDNWGDYHQQIANPQMELF